MSMPDKTADLDGRKLGLERDGRLIEGEGRELRQLAAARRAGRC